MSEDSKSSLSNGVSVMVSVEGEAALLSAKAALTDTIEMLIATIARTHGRVDIQAFSITVDDGDVACEPSRTVADLFNGKSRGRLHAHRCHRIDVSITYNGVVKHRQFSPAATVLRVFKWAVGNDGFDVATDAHDLELHMAGAVTPVDNSVHVGTLTERGKCEVPLLLVPSDRHQGRSPDMLSADVDAETLAPDARTLQAHLNSSEFLFGVDQGWWKEVRWDFPHVYVEISARTISDQPESFVFQFECSQYPTLAPLAFVWDLAAETSVDVVKRPTGVNHVGLVFRTNWQGLHLYTPFDRQALSTHPDWPKLHAKTAWNSSFTIQMYVRHLYDLLHSQSYTGVTGA